MAGTTNKDVRISNRKRLIKLLFSQGEMTKQDMALALNISTPTVSTLLKELEEKNLVASGTLQNSTGGRKASSYIPLLNTKCSIGADITDNHVRVVLLDLGCNILQQERYDLKREDTPEYWTAVDNILDDFGSKYIQNRSRLLDVGITLEETMQDGKIIQKAGHGTKINLDKVRQYFRQPITFRNSTKMAALAHIWGMEGNDNFVYLKIGKHIRGGIAYNGEMMDFAGINGEFGEILTSGATINHTYDISIVYTDLGYDNIEDYINAVTSNNSDAFISWRKYADELAVLLYNIYCIFGWQIILGGIATPLIEFDMDYLTDRILDINVFKKASTMDISISRYGEFGPAVGAAMLPIDIYLSK